jgi:hypothetical protein
MSGLFIMNINQADNTIKPSELSAAETYAVLNSVYKNNPSSLLAVSTQTELLTELIQDGNTGDPTLLNNSVKLQAASQTISLSKDYNFFHVKYTSALGPMAGACSNISTDNTVIDTYTYEDGNYFKSVSTNTDGTIYSITITDNSDTILYQGGNYAVRIANTNGTTDNTSSLTATTVNADNIEDLFGTQANVTKITEYGKDYYDVTLFKDISAAGLCSTDGNNENRQLVVVYRIDPAQDYHIVSTTYYLDLIDPNNIILRSTNTYEKATLDDDEAIPEYFQLDDSITIKEATSISNQTQTTTAATFMSDLATNNIPLLQLATFQGTITTYHSNFELISAIKDSSSYDTDPKFYSATNWQTFLKKNDISATHQVVLTYSQLDSNGTATADFAVIKKTDTTSMTCATGDDISITIDGKSYAAKISYADKTTVCFAYSGWQDEVSFASTDAFDLSQLIFSTENPKEYLGSVTSSN